MSTCTRRLLAKRAASITLIVAAIDSIAVT